MDALPTDILESVFRLATPRCTLLASSRSFFDLARSGKVRPIWLKQCIVRAVGIKEPSFSFETVTVPDVYELIFKRGCDYDPARYPSRTPSRFTPLVRGLGDWFVEWAVAAFERACRSEDWLADRIAAEVKTARRFRFRSKFVKTPIYALVQLLVGIVTFRDPVELRHLLARIRQQLPALLRVKVDQDALVETIWTMGQVHYLETPDIGPMTGELYPAPLHVFLAYSAVFHWNDDVFAVLVDPQFGLDVELFMRYAATEGFCAAVLGNLLQQWGPAKEVTAIMDWLFDQGWKVNLRDPAGEGRSFVSFLHDFQQDGLLDWFTVAFDKK
ncbi:hypothetical protein H9P43_005077 [Blastocladiella emersonii ATCC 22665]|nr:hypothetical protein H9P43_005077 [Blastocladiella emersonii ATCC 22665]